MDVGMLGFRDACEKWRAHVLYDSNRAEMRVHARAPIPPSELDGAIRSFYSGISHLAPACMVLDAALLDSDLLASPSFLSRLPRAHLFHRFEHMLPGDHAYVYNVRVFPMCDADTLMRGQWIVHIENARIARIKRAYLLDVIEEKAVVRPDRAIEMPPEVREVLERSQRHGVAAPGDGFFVPVRFARTHLREAPETWAVVAGDPGYDNSPSLAPHRLDRPLFPQAVRSDDGKIKYQTACKATEYLALRERHLTFTVDMGGRGARADRIRKRFCIMDVQNARRVFHFHPADPEQPSLRMFWSDGEWTGRYLYEYILTWRACRFYLDLDLDLGSGGHEFSGDEIAQAAVSLVCAKAREMFAAELRPEDFLVLECDRASKISRHIVARPLVFETVTDARVFANYLRTAALCDDAFRALRKPGGECIIDLAVYNVGCQSFRPYGCSKAPDEKNGPMLPMRIAAMNRCPVPRDEFDRFMFSLVQCVSFDEVPRDRRVRFVADSEHEWTVFVGRAGRSIAPCPVQAEKRKERPMGVVKEIRPRVPRLMAGNEVAIGMQDRAAVFNQVVEWLDPAWRMTTADLRNFDVRMMVRDDVSASFALFRKPGKGGYCAILARAGGTATHKRSGVQIYVYRGHAGWSATQRCRFRCGEDAKEVLFRDRASSALDAIVAAQIK
jgi:hypothetical protein